MEKCILKLAQEFINFVDLTPDEIGAGPFGQRIIANALSGGGVRKRPVELSGRPARSTGAFIVNKLVHKFHRNAGRYRLATMCIGGGQGIAAIFERI